MIQLLTLASLASASLLEAPIGYHQVAGQNFNTVKLSVGSPAQSLTLVLDTGSSDTWMPAPNVSGALDSFDPTKSSTFAYRQPQQYFAMRYGDGAYAGGHWGSDTVSVGAAEVSGMSVAVVVDTNTEIGTFGLGPPELSSSLIPKFNQPTFSYDSFMDLLGRSSGGLSESSQSFFLDSARSTMVFSTWLAGSERTGVLTFGGYDKSRYHGELNWVPIVSGIHYQVQSETIAVNGDIYSHPGIYHIDTGAESLHLPQKLFELVVRQFGGAVTAGGMIPCNSSLPEGSITFRFGHGYISVPLSDLVNPLTFGGKPARDELDREICRFGAQPSSALVLGGAFLRSAYVVFDWEKQRIGLAQAKTTVGDSRDFVVVKRGLKGANSSTMGLPLQANEARGVDRSGLLMVVGMLFLFM
jgi:yapsin 1